MNFGVYSLCLYFSFVVFVIINEFLYDYIKFKFGGCCRENINVEWNLILGSGSVFYL